MSGARLVQLWHDSFKGWRLQCGVCGPLGDFGKYWTAQRAAEIHEAIHAEDEPPAIDSQEHLAEPPRPGV